jgi:hypothetical protein
MAAAEGYSCYCQRRKFVIRSRRFRRFVQLFPSELGEIGENSPLDTEPSRPRRITFVVEIVPLPPILRGKSATAELSAAVVNPYSRKISISLNAIY